jgi:dTDP-4-dehydrorhamnose reductase
VPAEKWQANNNPEADWAGITKLLDVLATVSAGRFVLISTIDVYPHPIDVDEETDLSTLSNHAYGVHRFRVEQFVREKFPRHQVLRLPGLFGHGIKKNVIFDLLHNNCVEMIHPDGVFQYYSLHLLWEDIRRAIEYDISVLNLATEPIMTRTIVERFFPKCTLEPKSTPAPRYDFRSRFATHWGGSNGYLYSAEEILAQLASFIADERLRLS